MGPYESQAPQISLFRNAFIETDDSKKLIRHYISSNQVNDYRQLLDPKKYEDQMYRLNPIVLFEHGGSGFFGSASVSDSLKYKIGKNNKCWVEEANGIVYLAGETEFRNDSEEAMDIFNLYKNGFMNAWSKFIKPIGKPKWDDENNMIIYDTWTQREYSAVDLPVDGFAVGSDTYENAISLCKTSMLKHRLSSRAIGYKMMNDFRTSDESQKIAELENKINSINPGITKDEAAQMINGLLNQYTETLVPKLTEMINSQSNKLRDLTRDVEATARNACAEFIGQFMGKLPKN